ncbi:MAG: universal stress protein [Micropruina sp.]|nr:universal stress protein [Micropruina sp.]
MTESVTALPRVLVGFDASDDCLRALEHAVWEAKAIGAELHLVYVADDTVLNSAWGVVFDPEAIRQAAEAMLASGVEVSKGLGLPAERIFADVVLGAPSAALSQLSQSAALVVVGRRSSSESDRRFAGSTAVGLAATSRCPVVVVSAEMNVHPGRPMGVAVDSTGRGAKALDWALTQHPRYGDSVEVLSVCRAPSGRFLRHAISDEQKQQAMEVTQQRVNQMVAEAGAKHPEIPITAEVLYGSPVDELSARSEQLGVLLLEVQTSFPTYSIGGVIRGVMAHAHCPVVLIR